MSIKQSIWSLEKKEKISNADLKNEAELEDLIYDNIDIIDDNLMVIGRQVRLHNLPLDILCIDPNLCPVIIELKKDRTPREVVAQALDYASSVSEHDIKWIAELYESIHEEPFQKAFEKRFDTKLAPDYQTVFEELPRMIVVAAKMDPQTERIVNYLNNEYNVNINVLFFNIFEHGDDRLLSRAWMIDEEERQNKRDARNKSWNGEYYGVFKESHSRTWADAIKFGFFSAGGGDFYSRPLLKLTVGDRIWVLLQGKGYCGLAEVLEEATPADQCKMIFEGKETDFLQLPGLQGDYYRDQPEKMEYIVKVRWIVKKQIGEGQWGPDYFSNQNIICAPTCQKWIGTVNNLKKRWDIND